jgi:sulfate permease, SulP family
MAALLVVAGVRSVRRQAVLDIWYTGLAPRLVMVVTLVMTLIVPLQTAVFLGVALSILVYVLTSSREVRVSELVTEPDGVVRERAAPEGLASRAVTVLQISGNIFFAAASQIESLLPSAKAADRPVVILRLRSQESIGSTFIRVLERYSSQVSMVGGRLMLAGVQERVRDQLDRTEITRRVLGAENVFMARDTLGTSTRQAMEVAQGWLDAEHEPPSAEG